MSGACPELFSSKVTALDRHVGSRLRLRRRAVDLSQQQLAALIGVSYQQVHKYEKGLSRITAGHLHGIAVALGTDVAYYFKDVRYNLIKTEKQNIHQRLVELTSDVLRMADRKSQHAVCLLARALADDSAQQLAEPA